ncbi:MAG TPA: hypothetical protein VF476_08205 [Chitinophagaceae bacterium]
MLCSFEGKPGRSKRPGFFYAGDRKMKTGRYVMKFLLVVLAIHFIVELISNRKANNSDNKAEELDEETRHPAEFDLR